MIAVGIVARQIVAVLSAVALVACADRTQPADRAVTECRAAYPPGSPEFRICYRGVLAYHRQVRP